MIDLPLGFHITFGTYGTRLHGDARGTVGRGRNQPGDPIIGLDSDWEREEASRLKYAPVYLDTSQRRHVQLLIPDICRRGGWKYHMAAGQPDHAHALVTADRAAIEGDGTVVRRLLTRWLSEAMTGAFGLEPGRRWWAEGGSVKWIWDRGYYENVYGYVERQRV